MAACARGGNSYACVGNLTDAGAGRDLQYNGHAFVWPISLVQAARDRHRDEF